MNQQKAEFRGLVGKRDQYDTMELDLQKNRRSLSAALSEKQRAGTDGTVP
ncbi:hypothetical protein QW180_02615 [Vibrio sinaloensis]|nr:hypothetical protein [Vibrio sinaloensis]